MTNLSPQSPIATLLVVALPSEARPLLQHWQLQRDPDSRAFAQYRNRDSSIWLVVSGVGKVNAAAACAHVYHSCGSESAVWLNVGIAGHRDMPLGTPFLAHTLVDAGSEKAFYPPILFKPPCDTDLLRSVDRPTRNLPMSGGVDMEASAFFTCASRYSSAELVHGLKVVSDNANSTIDNITDARVCHWIEEAIGPIAALRDSLVTLATKHLDPLPQWPATIRDIRLTVSQRNQVRDLLRRYSALEGNANTLNDALKNARHARDVIAMLRAQIDAQTVSY